MIIKNRINVKSKKKIIMTYSFYVRIVYNTLYKIYIYINIIYPTHDIKAIFSQVMDIDKLTI